MSSAKTASPRGDSRANPKKKSASKTDVSRQPVKHERSPASAMLGALLLFSGAAALIYQVLWIKQLSLVVGVEVYSIAIAVSAFFAGLAAGSFALGRWADRVERPSILYAALEGGIALFGINATLLLAHAAGPFAAMEAHIGVLAWALPFALVGVPAFLMGGTLPVAIRAWSLESESLSRAGGFIYAVNTAGGIAGALSSTFAFLPWFGVRGTAVAAAALNLTSALIAVSLNRRWTGRSSTVAPVRLQGFSAQERIALGLYAVAGGVALGYEVVWSQAIIQFLSTRSFAFSIVLATYLAGLAVGSALYARFTNKAADSWGIFGLLIAAAGLVALAEIAFLSIWQLHVQAAFGDLIYKISGDQLARMCARFLVAAIGIVFVPTVLLGAAFPAALRLIVSEGHTGRDAGTVLALNTAGGIVGTLVTGFVLVPRLGLVRALGILAVVACLVGIAAVVRGRPNDKRLCWAVVAIGIAALAVSFATPADRFGRLLAATRGGSLIFYEESKAGTVAVVQQGSEANTFRRLYIQGVSNSGDALPSLRYMRLQALLPLMIHRGTPHSALVIGFGTGVTAGALLKYPQLERRVSAELLPAVVAAGPLFRGNFRASKDPQLEIRIRDGRRELIRSTERYDLITLEPPPPSASGVVNLYSSDFYRLAVERLEPDGLFAQWLPIATQNDEDTRSLVQSFLDVFPYATLWTTELHEMLLVGSLAPIELDVDQISERFALPEVAQTMKEVGIASPAALLATWVTGRGGLKRYAAGALPVTDDRPRIEYATWLRPNEITRVLPAVLSVRTEPPLIDASSVFSSEVSTERENLMKFYAAGLDAYRGDRREWAKDIGEALKNDADNPYFRWAVGQ